MQQDDKIRLIEIYERRLQKLREQQALRGINSPPELFIEIEDIEKKLEELNSKNSPTPPSHSTDSIIELPLDYLPNIAPLPENSRMPFSHNPLFVGREEDFKYLASFFHKEKNPVPILAITGIGGVGKTQMASEFVHYYGRFFIGGVFWLNFSKPEDIPAEIVECGNIGYLNLYTDNNNLSLDEKTQLVRGAWRHKTPRLLIFDNCEDEETLHQWRPSTGGCKVIVTSRRANWSKILGIQTLQLFPLKTEESVTLICNYVENLSPDDLNLTHISYELGNLPLAIHLAGSYLSRYKSLITPELYVEQLRQAEIVKHPSLLNQIPEISPTGYENSIARVFAVSIEKLKDEDPNNELALDLLSRAAVFTPDETIPRLLLLATLNKSPIDEEITVLWNEPHSVLSPKIRLAAEEGINRLLDLGLLTQRPNKSLEIHRLLARFVAYSEEVKYEVWDAIIWVSSQFKEIDRGRSRFMFELLPHLRTLATITKNRQDKWEYHFCSLAGLFSFHLGDYSNARPYLEHSLSISHSTLDYAQSKDRVYLLYALGNLLNHQGEYQSAKSTIEEGLAICQKIFGERSRATAEGLRSIADVQSTLGEYSQAELNFKKSLSIFENQLGRNDHSVADTLRSLGNVFKSQARYVEAEENYREALEIHKTVSGDKNFLVAITHNDLGLLLIDRREFSEARLHLEQALEIDKALYGEKHPEIAVTYNNLGQLYEYMEDTEKSLSSYEMALSLNMELLGENHPRTAQCLVNLGSIFMRQFKFSEAEDYLERAISIDMEFYGQNHPEVATDLGNFATLFQMKGDHLSAQTYAEKALEIREATLGEQHPDTMYNLLFLFLLLGEQHKMEAQNYYNRLQSICQEHSNPDYPQIRQICDIVNKAIITVGSNFEKIPQGALGVSQRIFPDHVDEEIYHENWIYHGLTAMATVEHQFNPFLIVDWRKAENFLTGFSDAGIRSYNKTQALELVNALDLMRESVSKSSVGIKQILRDFDPELAPILILSTHDNLVRSKVILVSPSTFPEDELIQMDASVGNVDAINRLKSMGVYKQVRKKFNKIRKEPKLYIINWMQSEPKIPVMTLISLDNRTTWGVHHFFGNPKYTPGTIELFIKQRWGDDVEFELSK